MKQLIVAALFGAILMTVVTAEEHHKKCCMSCKSNYPNGHHLKHSCLRGCRLYSMIYLAHDKSIPDTEISSMCSKSCQNGFSGMLGGADGSKACLTGCREQERVFKEHGLDEHGAKMSVMHGLGMAPDMHSMAPFHHRIFQQMREMHERMQKAMSGVKNAVIQRIQIRIHALPPGPDGKPRYQVEIHQQRVPFVFSRPTLPFGPGQKKMPESNNSNNKQQPQHHMMGGDKHDMMMHHEHREHDMMMMMNHNDDEQRRDFMRKAQHHMKMHGHVTVMYRVRHFFTDMSEPAKAALRWSLFGLLLVSVLCLGWLCCRTCRRAVAGRQAVLLEKPRLSLTKAFTKKRQPCVQSGDIFYVDVNDKKPLIEADGNAAAAADRKDEA